jgi:hypothetical protein
MMATRRSVFRFANVEVGEREFALMKTPSLRRSRDDPATSVADSDSAYCCGGVIPCAGANRSRAVNAAPTGPPRVKGSFG